jgi:hypothetical protein
MLTRRSTLFALAAPAIVSYTSLMPVRALSVLSGRNLTTLYIGGYDFYIDQSYPVDLPQLGTYDKPWRTLQQAMDFIIQQAFKKDEKITINFNIAFHELDPHYIKLDSITVIC